MMVDLPDLKKMATKLAEADLIVSALSKSHDYSAIASSAQELLNRNMELISSIQEIESSTDDDDVLTTVAKIRELNDNLTKIVHLYEQYNTTEEKDK